MRIRTLAACAALTIGAATPAGAAHVDRVAVKAMIVDTFGTHAGHALRVAACESGYDPHARHVNRNGTVDYGVFQINSGGTLQSLGITAAQALDAETNIRAAYRLFRKRGWQPWVCSRSRR